MNRCSDQIDGIGGCGSLGVTKECSRVRCSVGIIQECDLPDLGRCRPEQFQPFAGGQRFDWDEPGNIAARTRQAFDKSAADRIANQREYDWYRVRCLKRGGHRRRTGNQQRIRSQIDQFLRKYPILGYVAAAPTIVDRDSAAIHPAQSGQLLDKCGKPGALDRVALRRRHQHPDPVWHLLPARNHRPRGRTSKSSDEAASFHSMTSSARPISEIGTVMPSAFAVFMLMISWIFVAC